MNSPTCLLGDGSGECIGYQTFPSKMSDVLLWSSINSVMLSQSTLGTQQQPWIIKRSNNQGLSPPLYSLLQEEEQEAQCQEEVDEIDARIKSLNAQLESQPQGD